MKNKTAWMLLAAAFLGGFSSVSWADDWDGQYDDAFIKSRTYIGGYGTWVHIDANHGFDGNSSVAQAPATVEVIPPTPPATVPTTIWSFLEINLIPAIDRNYGFGALAGHREGAYAMEFSFWRSDHTATWGGFTDKSVFSTINIDLKRYFFVTVPTQVFVNMGLNFPWLTTRNSSFNFDPNYGSYPLVSIHDSTIQGIGLNLGAGLEVYLGDNISLVGAAVQRFTVWDQINGANESPANRIYFNGNYKIGPYGNFEGNGLNFYVGTTLAFPGL